MPMVTSTIGPKVAPRGCLALFLAVFALMGTAIGVVILRQVWRQARVYSWSAVPARIVRSNITEAPSDTSAPEWHLSYRYNVDGKDYFGERFTVSSNKAAEAADIYRWGAAYPVDSDTIAYVDRTAPADSVLQREFPWVGVALIVPFLFAGIGFVGIYYICKPAASGPVTNQAAGGSSPLLRVGGALFFIIFLGVGIGASVPLLFRPTRLYIAARSWVATPCQIVSSRVRSYSGDSTTYAPEIVYRYVYGGRSYTAARYKFYPGSSSGYRGKVQQVRSYPPGLHTQCFVDPADPADSVLDRSPSNTMLIGLVPLVFAAVGLFGLFKVLQKPSGEMVTVRAAPVFGESSPVPMAESVDGWRRPTISRRARAGASGFFALFWNIIIVFIFYNMQRDFTRTGSYFGMLVLVPFVIAGLFLAVRAWREVGNINSPMPQIRMDPSTVRLGHSVGLEWHIMGRTDRLESMHFFLVGEEAATYSRGTTATTDKNIFYEKLLAESASGQEYGRATVTIPADSMHSFQARHNRITWYVRVATKARLRPAVQDDFEVLVEPQAKTANYG